VEIFQCPRQIYEPTAAPMWVVRTLIFNGQKKALIRKPKLVSLDLSLGPLLSHFWDIRDIYGYLWISHDISYKLLVDFGSFFMFASIP
jgi:hypothetical protein